MADLTSLAEVSEVLSDYSRTSWGLEELLKPFPQCASVGDVEHSLASSGIQKAASIQLRSTALTLQQIKQTLCLVQLVEREVWEGRGSEGTEHVVCRENERELKVLWRCVWEPKLHYFCCH